MPKKTIASLMAIVIFTGCCIPGCGGTKKEPAPPASPMETAHEEPKEEPPAGEPETKPPLAKDEAVKQAALKLFEHCKNGENEKAAAYIIYRGPDVERKWKSVYRYDVEAEKEPVDEICADIKQMLAASSSYEFTQFETETESEGEWLVWEVEFQTGGGADKAYFAFLRVRDSYALGDID
ncbi:MAG: hypothetical protein ABIJ56_11065 [Pseudomonadota bacterium]